MENLKLLRKEQGLTLDQLAMQLGLTRQVLSRYERGERQADYSTLIKIAKYFDVSVDYLLGNSTYYYPDLVRGRKGDFTTLEEDLITLFRRLPAQTQDYVFGIVKSLAVNS